MKYLTFVAISILLVSCSDTIIGSYEYRNKTIAGVTETIVLEKDSSYSFYFTSDWSGTDKKGKYKISDNKLILFNEKNNDTLVIKKLFFKYYLLEGEAKYLKLK